MRRYILSILLVSVITLSTAQVQVDNSSQTVADLIQTTLIGEGVDVFNITINGQPGNQIHLQAGSFSDETSSVGMSSGVIMGSGNVMMAEQPNTSGSSSLPGVPVPYNDPDLESLSNFPVNDQCVIEFDFIPQGDTLRFNYIFASEEYPEFGCSSFNDVFGFFLSGNNPDGGIYTNENIALVPDPDNPGEYVDVPVAINSINDGMNGTPANCEAIAPDYLDYVIYYVDNEFNPDYEYDGRTVVLTAQAIVNCGEVYHIKLGIGDGSDQAYDSAVFLEANSFSAEPTGISAESLFPLGLVEISSNCDEGYARIGRPCAADTAYYQLNYLVNDSTAEYGVDYEPLPTEIMLPTFISDSIFPIQTIPDGIAEDVEYICIELLEAFEPEGPFVVVDTACIAIIDNYTFDVSVNEQVLWCPEDIATLNAFAQFPAVAPFDYEWFLDGNLESTENPYVAPTPENYGDSLYYTLEMVDFCGAVNNPTEVLVANRIRVDPFMTGVSTLGDYCPGIDYRLRANFDGGTYPISFNWIDQFGQTYDDAQEIFVDPSVYLNQQEGVEYFVHVSDACNPTRYSDTISYFLEFPEILDVQISTNDIVCTEQELELTVSASGGYPPYSYTWNSDPILLPPNTFPSPDGFLTNDVDGEGIAFGFHVPEDMSENLFNISLELNDWCSSALDTVPDVFCILGEDAQNFNYCPSVDTDTVTALNCIYPNVVSPNDDGVNDAFIINELINRPGTLFIYNRWGNLLAETNRNTWNIIDEPAGTYYYVVQFEDGEEKKGYFTIVR